MTCTNCQGQTAPGIYLCKLCIRRLEDVLTQIEDALEVADDTIAKQDRMGAGGAKTSASTDPPAPINFDTMERRRELWEEVGSYARMVLEEDDSDDLCNVPPLTYLRLSMDLIATQDFAGEMLDTLEGAAQKLWRSVDCRPDVIALGQCGAVHEGVPCPGVLRAHKGDRDTRCRICGRSENVEELRQDRFASAWEHFMPLSEVVKAARSAGHAINPRSARRWAERGEMPVLRYREDGVKLFSPGQVVDTHQRMKAKHGGKRERAA